MRSKKIVAMMVWVAGLLAASGGSLAAGESAERFAAAVEKQRAIEVEWLEKSIAFFVKQRSPERALQIKASRARIAALKAGAAAPTPIIDPFNLNVGDVGMLGKLGNVTPPEQARKLAGMEAEILEVADYRIMQVIDKSSVLLSIEDPDFKRSSVIVILEGIGTENLVDDDKLAMNKIYEVSGTRSYQTVLGANKKVLVLRPFNPAE